VKLNRNEVITKVQYAIAGFEVSIFDLASANFANFLMQDNGIEGVMRALAELENRTCWNGDPAVGLYGVKTHPYLTIQPQTVTTASSAEAIANAVLKAINAIYTNNFGTFTPTHVALSIKMMAYLKSRTLAVAGTPLAISILDWVAQQNVAGIPKENFVAVQELNDAGPGGTQGMFVYGKNEDAVRIIAAGGVQALPVQYIGTNVNQIFYMGSGGLNMYNPANNGLSWWDLQ
jgi:hypothetical protein